MSYQIDELINKYDIYNNPHISDEEIKKIAEVILADKSINLKEYFALSKCQGENMQQPVKRVLCFICWLYTRVPIGRFNLKRKKLHGRMVENNE